MSKQISILKENSHIIGVFENEQLANQIKDTLITKFENYKKLRERVMNGEVETYIDAQGNALVNHVDYQGMSVIELYGLVNDKKIYTVNNYTILTAKDCELPYDELKKLLR